MSLGNATLDWMLRRLEQGTPLTGDLVMVRDHEVFADAGATLDRGDTPWRVEHVTGELTLRDVLPGDDPLIALVPEGFIPPLDLAARSYLGRVLSARAEDVVAGHAGRFCEPLLDPLLGPAVLERHAALGERLGEWSLAATVTAGDVTRALIAAELGVERRLPQLRDSELLAAWIVDGAPRPRLPELVTRALANAFGRRGAWLAWALAGGSVEQLVAAGALAGSDAGRAASPDVPAIEEPSDGRKLRRLVERAVRDAHDRDPSRTVEVLAEGERRYHGARVPVEEAREHPLLRAALEQVLHAAAAGAAAGEPLDESLFEGLGGNLHARDAGDVIALASDLARVARFSREVQAPADGSGSAGWLELAHSDVAWADLAWRRARRQLPSAPADLAAAADRVSQRYLQRRDELNAAFAKALAADWPRLAGNRDLREPIALHQLGRCLLRRLVDDGHRVLLIVLDGCDLSTFLELVRPLARREHIGLVVPEVRDAVLRGDLGDTALRVAAAPLPTVTAHARRALFAGEIPGNTALDDTESEATTASGDRRAFERHTALGSTARALLLKGDLGDGCRSWIERLASGDERLLAVVLNGVDDALASHETTAIGPWSVGALGAGVLDALRAAVEHGWTVVVTADHGHTPHVDGSRKALGRGLGQRFHDAPVDGAQAFTSGPLPSSPLHLLTRVGAWNGGQRRGYHGGGALEEVAVPLAFLGRVGAGEGRPEPPAWWFTSAPVIEIGEDAAPTAEPGGSVDVMATPDTTSSPAVVADDIRSLLAGKPTELRAVELLAEHQVLTVAQLGRLLSTNELFVRGAMGRALRLLGRAGATAPFEVDEAGERVTYRWTRRS